MYEGLRKIGFTEEHAKRLSEEKFLIANKDPIGFVRILVENAQESHKFNPTEARHFDFRIITGEGGKKLMQLGPRPSGSQLQRFLLQPFAIEGDPMGMGDTLKKLRIKPKKLIRKNKVKNNSIKRIHRLDPRNL